MTSVELLGQGVEAARAGRRVEARELFMQVVEIDPRNEMAWMWLAGLVESLEDRIIACENVLTINPGNAKVKTYLDGLLQQKGGHARVEKHAEAIDAKVDSAPSFQAPLQEKIVGKTNLYSLAEQLEEDGKFDEALDEYKALAAKTKKSTDFDFIYKQIVRIEGLQKENVQYIPPSTSILRMTFTWPLLYLSFALVQVGLKPFAHPAYIWLGLPWVVFGSFLLSLSEIRVRHVIWQKIFLEDGNGSTFARIVLAIAGWLFVLIPFVLILLDSLARLQSFQIPPEPFFR